MHPCVGSLCCFYRRSLSVPHRRVTHLLFLQWLSSVRAKISTEPYPSTHVYGSSRSSFAGGGSLGASKFTTEALSISCGFFFCALRGVSCVFVQFLQLFPRHVIIGWVAGFGVFLVTSGLEVSTGLPISSMGFLESTRAFFSEVGGINVERMALRTAYPRVGISFTACGLGLIAKRQW